MNGLPSLSVISHSVGGGIIMVDGGRRTNLPVDTASASTVFGVQEVDGVGVTASPPIDAS